MPQKPCFFNVFSIYNSNFMPNFFTEMRQSVFFRWYCKLSMTSLKYIGYLTFWIASQARNDKQAFCPSFPSPPIILNTPLSLLPLRESDTLINS